MLASSFRFLRHFCEQSSCVGLVNTLPVITDFLNFAKNIGCWMLDLGKDLQSLGARHSLS